MLSAIGILLLGLGVALVWAAGVKGEHPMDVFREVFGG